MAETIYFQWQNDALRKTIYPARDMKLRHFLLYYYEVDLWREYKNKKIEDCTREIKEYEQAQAQAITGAYKREKELRDYFLKDSNEPLTPETDSEDVKKEKERLKQLHQAFQKYFPLYKNEQDESAQDRKEKIFVAMRIAEWEQHRKEIKQKIAKKKSEILERTILPRVEKELEQLSALVTAQNKLEKRKQEFAERKKKNLKEEAKILPELQTLWKRIAINEAEQKRIKDMLARLSNFPDLEEVLRYFSSEKRIEDEIDLRFGQGTYKWEQSVVDALKVAMSEVFDEVIGNMQKEILPFIQQWKDRGKNDPGWLSGTLIKNQYDRTNKAQKKLDKVILKLESKIASLSKSRDEKKKSLPDDSTELKPLEDEIGFYQNVRNILSGAAMREVITGEMDKLQDLRAAIDYPEQTREDLDKAIEKENKNLEKVEKQLSTDKDDESKKNKEYGPIKTALEIKREKYLSEYVPDRDVSKEDIVNYLAEKYYASLLELDHDELLDEIFKRFWKEPERFPPWLQYMVIHFSGMRYASAHGSWADPKDLLRNLRSLDIQEELKEKDEDKLKADCEGRAAAYDRSKRNGTDPAMYLPKFAQAGDKHSEEKIRHYLKGLNSERHSDRREAFFNLRIDEENEEINAMTSEEALEELKLYKDKLNLPDIMWKEIVKLTDLRLTEVTSENWETLTPDEQKERLSIKDKKLWKFQDILNQWKAEHLTGWRDEHDRANRLVVTRAVCNEVAEHIQHLRGHKSAAGLTQKPNWYRKEEDKYHEALKKGERIPRSYFVKARKKEQFKEGASILWLRFVHEVPNEWRVARDLTTREGDRLIASEYLGRKPESGGWVYEMGDVIKRTRMGDPKKGLPKQQQWLRWMHEATVAAVEEINEKTTIVLTFETALPYEDPSLSTIGLFKRYLHHLTDDLGEDAYNPAFIGFVPEGKIPASDLEEMLDWNRILRREAVSAAALEAWREKYIRKRKPPVIEVIDERPKPEKALLPICDFVKWTDSLVTPDNNLWKVRIWGDPKLGGLTVESESVKEKAPSNFQAVGLYNDVTGRGAVSNFITIERDDINNLIAMQIEDEYEAKEKDKDWLEQKMKWLCKEKGTIYFTKDTGHDWETGPFIFWGTVALGGNLVQVKRFIRIQIKEGRKKKEKEMAELVGFRKSDWNRPLDELLAEGLVHRCFCAYSPGDKPGESPKGIAYSPFFSLQDWKFGEKGQKKPKALYLPAEQLVKPCLPDENGKVYEGIWQRLKCKDKE